MHTGCSSSLVKRHCAGQRAGECGAPRLPLFALVLSSRGDEAQRSVLVHTMALELNQRGAMQAEEGSKEGQRLVLLTESQNKVNTTSMTASGRLFPPSSLRFNRSANGMEPTRSELEQTVRVSNNDSFRHKHRER